MFPFKLHLVEFGRGLTDGLVQNTVLFLNVLDPGLGSNLAALAQGRHRLAQVFVLLLQTLQLKTRNQECKNCEGQRVDDEERLQQEFGLKTWCQSLFEFKVRRLNLLDASVKLAKRDIMLRFCHFLNESKKYVNPESCGI